MLRAQRISHSAEVVGDEPVMRLDGIKASMRH